MKHRRRKTALLSAAAAAVLVLQGSFAALAASPQFAYDADTWAKLQDNVMEYSELPYLVQEYNPTYLNNQTTYQAGRDTKNAKEVQDKQYNQASNCPLIIFHRFGIFQLGGLIRCHAAEPGTLKPQIIGS